MTNTIKNTLIVTVIIFAALFLYTKFGPPIPFTVSSINATKGSLFTVTGEGKVTAVPDEAIVRMGMTVTKPTVGEAQNEVNLTINKLLGSLSSMGIEKRDIKTENYSLNPQYGPNNRINGYALNSTLVITVRDISKVNNVIDRGTQDGLNNVGNVEFTLSDTKRKEVTQQARIDAVKQAKEKASSLANAAGIHLGRIVNVEESTGTQPGPIMYNAMDKSAVGLGGGAPTQVEPGTADYTLTVSLSYELQ